MALSAGTEAGVMPRTTPTGGTAVGTGSARIASIRSAAVRPAAPGVIAGRQRPQRQEELGDDDQDGERPVEGDRPVHQAKADLDRDERDRDRAAPLEHERGLERGPEHLHRRVAVAPAHVADGVDLLGAAAEQLERRDPLEHVEEERAQPAQLGEAALGDRPAPGRR